MSVSLTEALGGEKPDQPETLQAGTYIAPIWLQSLTYPAASDRLLIDTVWGTGGVVGGAALSVGPRASGGNMSVDIQPGTVVVAGGDVAGQGKYVGRLTAAVNVPLAAPPGAGLTRIDLVYARVYDATAAGGTLNQLTVEEVATGVAAASNPGGAGPAGHLRGVGPGHRGRRHRGDHRRHGRRRPPPSPNGQPDVEGVRL